MRSNIDRASSTVKSPLRTFGQNSTSERLTNRVAQRDNLATGMVSTSSADETENLCLPPIAIQTQLLPSIRNSP
jgi:hypothetical protein